MKIRLTKNYSTYRIGAAVDCEDETALRLIRDGIAERADLTPKKRGRPRAVPQPQNPDAASG